MLHIFIASKISTIPPLGLIFCSVSNACVLATSICSVSETTDSFHPCACSRCCHLFRDVLFPLPSFTARCFGGLLYEAFPSFYQYEGRI